MIPNLLLLLFLDGDWQRSQPIRRERHHLHAMLFSRPSDYRQKLKCMLSYKHLSLRRIQIFSTFPRWMPFILWPAPRDFVCCFLLMYTRLRVEKNGCVKYLQNSFIESTALMLHTCNINKMTLKINLLMLNLSLEIFPCEKGHILYTCTLGFSFHVYFPAMSSSLLYVSSWYGQNSKIFGQVMMLLIAKTQLT